jgi:hypothetical protein
MEMNVVTVFLVTTIVLFTQLMPDIISARPILWSGLAVVGIWIISVAIMVARRSGVIAMFVDVTLNVYHASAVIAIGDTTNYVLGRPIRGLICVLGVFIPLLFVLLNDYLAGVPHAPAPPVPPVPPVQPVAHVAPVAAVPAVSHDLPGADDEDADDQTPRTT